MRRPPPAERTLLPRNHPRPGWQEDQTFALPAQGSTRGPDPGTEGDARDPQPHPAGPTSACAAQRAWAGGQAGSTSARFSNPRGTTDSGSYRQVGQPLTPQLQPGRRATRVPDRKPVAVDHHAEILDGRKWSRMTRALQRRTYDLFAGCPRLLSSRIAAAMRSCRSVAGWRTRGSPSIGSPRVLVAARAAASWISAYRAGAGRGTVRVSSSPRSWACATRAPMGCGRPALVTRASSP